jgi:hypothetical protein
VGVNAERGRGVGVPELRLHVHGVELASDDEQGGEAVSEVVAGESRQAPRKSLTEAFESD